MAVLSNDKKYEMIEINSNLRQGGCFFLINNFVEPAKLEVLVESKLRQHGITYYDYPFNPYDIIHAEGIILQEIPLENENIRGMIVHGPNATGILINKNRSYVSKRFIAMHELSHHWFHPHDSKIVCFEEYQSKYKGIEWQANYAAACALMPRKLVSELLYMYDGDITGISEWFCVSMESLMYRISVLGFEHRIKKKSFELIRR